MKLNATSGEHFYLFSHGTNFFFFAQFQSLPKTHRQKLLSHHPTIKSGNNDSHIYSLVFVKRYIVYANEQHINHIRCKNIKLYFFSRNRATILKQVRFDSVNLTNIAFRANQKQTKVPWDSQKKKANRNGICINLYKQDHLVYSYICHFLYACRISIYKNANFSLEM